METLVRLIESLPGALSERMEIDWVAVEAELGTALPQDYREFCEIYGPGTVDDFLTILHPSAAHIAARLGTMADRQLGGLKELRDQGLTELVPYAIFPEPGGVLPWGVTANGDACYWVTAGAPDAWKVVIADSRGSLWEPLGGGMAECLLGLISRTIVSVIFPTDFPSDHPEFVCSAR